MENIKKTIFVIIFSLFLPACGHRVMTMQTFYDVPNQITSQELKDRAGFPYAIRKKEGGVEEYEYIERITAGQNIVEERHYIFILKNDRVVSRKVLQSDPPPFDTNSYKLQTTKIKPRKNP